MLTLLIVFVSICLAGAAFWLLNKKQINSLVENIDDKQAIINALQTHVESVQPPQPKTTNSQKKNDGKRKYNKKKETTVQNTPNKGGYKPRRKPKTQQ